MGKWSKYSDVHGKRFGGLIVIGDMGSNASYEKFVLCKCDCGKEKKMPLRNIRIGKTKSCGCLTGKTLSKRRSKPATIGDIYGMLTISSDLGTSKQGRFVLCKCQCGNIKKIRMACLKRGDTISCGCYSSKMSKERNTTHGMSHTPIHQIWTSMLERCYNSNCKAYKNYGGRGVTVCNEWRFDFTKFYQWAIRNGWERGLHVDKDIKGDSLLYSPDTCLIVSAKENHRKRRSSRIVEYKGEKRCMAEWCDILSFPYNLTRQRIDRDGLSVEQAFNYKKTG